MPELPAVVKSRRQALDGCEAERRLARLGGLFWDWQLELPEQGLDADFAPPLRHVLAVTGPPCPAPRWSDPHHPNPNPNPNPSPNPAPH